MIVHLSLIEPRRRMNTMRSLDLLLVAAIVIGGTLWLAAALSFNHRQPQVAGPYVGPDYLGEPWSTASVNNG